jgi:hypothetical protein
MDSLAPPQPSCDSDDASVAGNRISLHVRYDRSNIAQNNEDLYQGLSVSTGGACTPSILRQSSRLLAVLLVTDNVSPNNGSSRCFGLESRLQNSVPNFATREAIHDLRTPSHYFGASWVMATLHPIPILMKDISLLE